MTRTLVLAVGGHALSPAGEPLDLTRQRRRVRDLARLCLSLRQSGHRLLLVLGNGPQVGFLAQNLPPAQGRWAMANAQSQGLLGLTVQSAFADVLRAAGAAHEPPPVLLTRTRVASAGPCPEKFVGAVLGPEEARQAAARGEAVRYDAGRGWRRAVASPIPVAVEGHRAVRMLLGRAGWVIAGIGGGLPVLAGGDDEAWLDGVVDKDLTAALLASHVRADFVAFFTEAPGLYVHFGRPQQRLLSRVSADELRALLDAGHFPEGSMGPKVRAALAAAQAGIPAAIASLAEAAQALAGRAGTLILPPAPRQALSGGDDRVPRPVAEGHMGR